MKLLWIKAQVLAIPTQLQPMTQTRFSCVADADVSIAVPLMDWLEASMSGA